jgi:hypothetical protein
MFGDSPESPTPCRVRALGVLRHKMFERGDDVIVVRETSLVLWCGVSECVACQCADNSQLLISCAARVAVDNQYISAQLSSDEKCAPRSQRWCRNSGRGTK